MAYLHCHNCDFSQDDFWDEHYNPVDSLKEWKNSLFEGSFDKPFTNCASFIKEHGNVSLREVIAQEFEKCAKIIRNMKYRTYEEFIEKNPEKICPKCGKKMLDID